MDVKRTLLWVDGYNVIFADQEMKTLAEQDVQAAAQLLVERVAEFAAVKDYSPVIFFDHKSSTAPVQEDSYLGVKIVSGNAKNSADDLMEKMNFGLAKDQDVVLVTSDNLLKQLVAYRTGKSRLIEAKDFAEQFLKARQGLKDQTDSSFKIFNAVSGEVKDLLEKHRHGSS